MTDLERRALLGDKQAQEECTRRGIVLACPCCKGSARIRYTGNNSGPLGYTSNVYLKSKPGFIMCDKCGAQTSKTNRACRALAKWNTRQAPPIGRCGECKHWYKQHCAHGPCATEPTDADFSCGGFEPKGGESDG